MTDLTDLLRAASSQLPSLPTNPSQADIDRRIDALAHKVHDILAEAMVEKDTRALAE